MGKGSQLRRKARKNRTAYRAIHGKHAILPNTLWHESERSRPLIQDKTAVQVDNSPDDENSVHLSLKSTSFLNLTHDQQKSYINQYPTDIYGISAILLTHMWKGTATLKGLLFSHHDFQDLDPSIKPSLFSLSHKLTSVWKTFSSLWEQTRLFSTHTNIPFQRFPLFSRCVVFDLVFGARNISICSNPSYPKDLKYLIQFIVQHRREISSHFKTCLALKGTTIKKFISQISPPQFLLFDGPMSSIPGRPCRWARINYCLVPSRKSCIQQLVQEGNPNFSSNCNSIQSFLQQASQYYKQKKILSPDPTQHPFYSDPDFDDFICFPPMANLTNHPLFDDSKLVIQDKASGFVAHFLLSGKQKPISILDATSAPGSKTTHVASRLIAKKLNIKIFANEMDPQRAKSLEKIITQRHCLNIHVIENNFFHLEPETYTNVSHIILDPSCSGSGVADIQLARNLFDGIVFGSDVVSQKDTIVPTQMDQSNDSLTFQVNSFKNTGMNTQELESIFDDEAEARVDTHPIATSSSSSTSSTPNSQKNYFSEEKIDVLDQDRIQGLADFQFNMIQHSLKFPNVKRISYSTCSIYSQENEMVVERALSYIQENNLPFRLASPPKHPFSSGIGDYPWKNKVVRCHWLKHQTIGFFCRCF